MFNKPPPPDRPLECSECKKPIAIRYTEIVGGLITNTSMCADCPEYLKRLHGGGSFPQLSGKEGGTGLACGSCGTTLDAVRMGNPLGCSVCYEVFSEELFNELSQSKKIPIRVTSLKKSTPVHLGRSPGEVKELNLSAKLLALNEALTETLKAEKYEEAALLRDQIKQLTEKTDEDKNAGKE
jgi:protein arginine kinase activator